MRTIKLSMNRNENSSSKQIDMAQEKGKILIIGASYAGLALGNILSRNEIPFLILDNKTPPFTYITGGSEFNLPSLQKILQALKLQLSKNESSPSRETIITTLLQRIKDHVRYGEKVYNIEKCKDGYYIHHVEITNVYKNSRDWKGEIMQRSGPFATVIGADGVLSICRRCGINDTYLIGDARWVNDRFYDLGFRRIDRGADLAMLDGIEFGNILVECYKKSSTFELGGIYKQKYCAYGLCQKSKRRKRLIQSLFVLLVSRILYLILCNDAGNKI